MAPNQSDSTVVESGDNIRALTDDELLAAIALEFYEPSGEEFGTAAWLEKVRNVAGTAHAKPRAVSEIADDFAFGWMRP